MAKCKILSPSTETITLGGSEVEHVTNFVSLDSVVLNGSEDVKRVSMVFSAFGRLRTNIWNKRDINQRFKVRLYNAFADRLKCGHPRSAKAQGYPLPQQNAEHPTKRKYIALSFVQPG